MAPGQTGSYGLVRERWPDAWVEPGDSTSPLPSPFVENFPSIETLQTPGIRVEYRYPEVILNWRVQAIALIGHDLT
jgi:hypothetical protein